MEFTIRVPYYRISFQVKSQPASALNGTKNVSRISRQPQAANEFLGYEVDREIFWHHQQTHFLNR